MKSGKACISPEQLAKRRKCTKILNENILALVSRASSDEENEKSLWNLKPIFVALTKSTLSALQFSHTIAWNQCKMICKASLNVYFHYIGENMELFHDLRLILSFVGFTILSARLIYLPHFTFSRE